MASRILSKSLKNVNSLFRGISLSQNLVKPTKMCIPSSISQNYNIRCFSVSLNNMQQNTNAFNDLLSFLNQEIKLEYDSRKNAAELPKLNGFAVKTEGPNVTLTKAHNNESITVKININHSLDNTDNIDESVQPDVANKDPNSPTQIKSRPAFTIDIKKGNQYLSFGCSFLPAEDGDKNSEDFQIDEFAIHEGDWNENVYTADCTVLDERLYDILLSILEERGMGVEFAAELAEFSTSYEHLQYVKLLEKLQNFSK